MKMLSVILLVVYFAMIFMPCADSHIVAGVDKENTFSDADHNHTETLDLCSPFCSCNCCHTLTVTVSTTALTFHSSALDIELFEYNHEPQNILKFVWKPPQNVFCMGYLRELC